ncbi:beclin 1-associated autophagy-related key regulator isoform X2 [Zootermopsis nevadensis]|nr:beclin 1-associated autophagy-related key regulator isoform X2 [Zootermopsis nevadensis]XP_021917116.1 beclin 1-associated autophagy-related key regulator isoform X2 [Zootermopsis nevadensis]XP_021917117.1 beclin 1-associated autophagy-related key regulator isoform X2 [Zootermopsis nevadensis]XP_021917118.1 beclin 1-associated autophagy-related key regulator isoform X2 [Zootermopsis nevadensis]
MRLHNDRRQLQELCDIFLQRNLHLDQLRTEIDACHERIALLRMIIQEKRKHLEEDKPKIANMIKQSQDRRARLPRYEEHVNKMERRTSLMGIHANETALAIQKEQQELKDMIRASIQQLVQYIFPIIPVQPVPSDEDCEQPRDTVTALADATRTAYIRGRWVFTDSSGQLQHCIVAPSLPDSGDYSAYNVWVAANKDGVPGGNSEGMEHNPAYNISAALTYTTQLVNVLAFYLDVRLPNKLCYSDFCGHEMTDTQFAHRVAKLNSNVLHLCYTQNVNPELLHPARTLHNILLLLNTEVSDLGRQGPLEVNPVLAKSLEDQLARDLELGEDSGSEDESDTLPLEWEAVPHVSCPESVPGPSQMSQQNFTSTQQATSMAGGLVTSAAASIASLWRGWTGTK